MEVKLFFHCVPRDETGGVLGRRMQLVVIQFGLYVLDVLADKGVLKVTGLRQGRLELVDGDKVKARLFAGGQALLDVLV